MFVNETFLSCLATAIVAFVYAVILPDDGNILAEWKLFLFRVIFGKCPNPKPENPGWRDYLFKVTIDCEKCIGGQMAFWYYLYSHFYWDRFTQQFDTVDFYLPGYYWQDHLVYVCGTIFIISIIKPLYVWINNKLNF